MIRQVGSWFVVAAMAASGCGNPAEFTALAGEYRMTKLVVTEDGSSRDFLALGMRATLILRTDGTTDGSFTSPRIAGLEDDTPFDFDLAGRYRVRGDSVALDHQADTFLKDAPLVREAGRLRATLTGVDAMFERQ